MVKQIELICCLCKKEYKGLGYYAYPLSDGRCCDKCNSKVMLARLKDLYKICQGEDQGEETQ